MFLEFFARHLEVFTGFFLVVLGQATQIAYHHYHDKRQNELLAKIEKNTAPIIDRIIG